MMEMAIVFTLGMIVGAVLIGFFFMGVGK